MHLVRTLLAIAVLLLLVMLWRVSAAHDPSPLPALSVEMAPVAGDVSRSLPRHPDGSTRWQALDTGVLANWTGPYWLRWRFQIPRQDRSHVLQLSLRAASQAYWNGRPLRPNGNVGSTGEMETPGQIDSVRVLPGALSGSVNELLVLGSSHHQWPTPYRTDAAARIVPTESAAATVPWRWLISAMAMGALAAACIYLLIAQRGEQRLRGTNALLALAGVGLLLPVVEAWRPLLGYTYPWHGPRLLLLLALHLAAAVLLPLYLARRFRVALPASWCVVYSVLLAGAAVFVPSFDGRGAAVLLMSLLASIALLLRATQERDERWPIIALLLTGIVVMIVAAPQFLDGPYFLLLSVLMGYMLLRHAAQIRSLRLHAAWLEAERARLSLQLLQRGIHPHWLMNTLTCLQELIEQAPTRASHLVTALAEQFDHLHRNSQQGCIPLQQELELCRNHLDIVGAALNQQVQLEVTGEGGSLHLPPGIVHAQIENTLTHAGAAACLRHPFRLTLIATPHTWVLELRSALGASPRPGSGTGTGTRFIEASLAGAFGDAWRFSQGPVDGSWCSRIEVTCAS